MPRNQGGAVRSVKLRNFRGFREFSVSFQKFSVVVGQNNAGKSTLIEALRILAIASRKALSSTFVTAPQWLRGHTVGFGFTISLDTVDFDFRNVQHNQNRDEPSVLEVTFFDGRSITVFVGRFSGEIFCQVQLDRDNRAEDRKSIGLPFPPIAVMPQVERFIPKEKPIAKSRIQEFLFGRLSYRHFRNQIYEYVPEYRIWKEIVERTWPRLQIQAPEVIGEGQDKEFYLHVREGGFNSEVAFAGGGLQAWLQTTWFLSRAPRTGMVVLDEPDTYLHADMQRKLVKLVDEFSFAQVVLATHSSEIISDVSPSDIVVVQKRERAARRPGNRAKIQAILESLGSHYNLQLSNLAFARKCIVFEGADGTIIDEVAYKIGNEHQTRLARTPFFAIEGAGNIQRAVGASRALRSCSDGQMPCLLVLDRDYRLEEDLQKYRETCLSENIQLTIWSVKEIENHLLLPEVIARFISKRGRAVTAGEISEKLDELARGLLVDVEIAVSDRLRQDSYNENAARTMARTRSHIEQIVEERGLLAVVGGKEALARLSQVCKINYGVSFSAIQIVREARLEDLPAELVDVTRELCAPI